MYRQRGNDGVVVDRRKEEKKKKGKRKTTPVATSPVGNADLRDVHSYARAHTHTHRERDVWRHSVITASTFVKFPRRVRRRKILLSRHLLVAPSCRRRLTPATTPRRLPFQPPSGLDLFKWSQCNRTVFHEREHPARPRPRRARRNNRRPWLPVGHDPDKCRRPNRHPSSPPDNSQVALPPCRRRVIARVQMNAKNPAPT